jgi:hypothetical protein
MSKLRNVMVALLALSVFMAIPAFALGNGNADCKNGKFVGSYVLRPLSTVPLVYKRLVASDADLLAP